MVTVARRGDLSIAEVAADFDVSKESVRRWMRQADLDDGIKDGLTTSEHRSSRCSGGPPPTSRGRRSQDEVPAGPGAGRSGFPGAVDLIEAANLFHRKFWSR
jgi:hypothetical protein